MDYYGKVLFIWAVETFANDFTKQTVVIEEDTTREFKGSIAVDFMKDKIELLKDVKVGHYVKVFINTKANESKKEPWKYFNSISCWKLEKKEDDDF